MIKGFVARLWRVDKLLLISLVVVAIAIYPMVTWAVDDYPRRGWRSLLYIGFMVYALLRLIYIARKRVDREDSTTVAAAERMQRVFRKGSQQDYDHLVAEEGAMQEAERAGLWAEAASSPRAARQLRQALQDEVQALDDIMRSMVKRSPTDKAGIEDIATLRKETEQQLARVRDLIHHLRA